MNSSYFSDDTIVAIATSTAGDAGVGIIRISGKNALVISDQVCEGFNSPEPRFLHRVSVLDRITKREIDDGLAVLFPIGSSFTGDQVVELQLHGGRTILQLVLKELLATGLCRLALPGEFTFRAVKNGKLSLNQAQGVIDLVTAKSRLEVDLARKQISSKRIEEFDLIAEKIRNILGLVELSIDFIDQDVEVLTENTLLNELQNIQQLLEDLLKKIQLTSRLLNGVPVVILGRPNVGKSSLFNALLAEDRSIVSDQAGTTRDIVSEYLQVNGCLLKILDTAGIRSSEQEIEQIGIEKAREASMVAELGIIVLDSTTETSKMVLDASEFTKNFLKNPILVINKSDLVSSEVLSRKIEALQRITPFVCSISAKTNNLKELLELLQRKLSTSVFQNTVNFSPSEFQVQMLSQCQMHICETIAVVKKYGLKQPEILSTELFSSAKSLSDLSGDTTPDSILNKIFSEFCIGK